MQAQNLPHLARWTARFLATNPPVGALLEAFGPFVLALFGALFLWWANRRLDAEQAKLDAAALAEAEVEAEALLHPTPFKRCSCGIVWSRIDWAGQGRQLEQLADQLDHDPDGSLAMRLELRNCQCGSTLARNALIK